MNITIEPTEEISEVVINGVKVPTRVWKGATEKGVTLEAFVLCIVPVVHAEVEALKAELPAYMKPARDTFAIEVEG